MTILQMTKRSVAGTRELQELLNSAAGWTSGRIGSEHMVRPRTLPRHGGGRPVKGHLQSASMVCCAARQSTWSCALPAITHAARERLCLPVEASLACFASPWLVVCAIARGHHKAGHGGEKRGAVWVSPWHARAFRPVVFFIKRQTFPVACGKPCSGRLKGRLTTILAVAAPVARTGRRVHVMENGACRSIVPAVEVGRVL